jgi:hypothetical protein
MPAQTKYEPDWTHIDSGREGLWDSHTWLGVLDIISRHEGESVYDPSAAIYGELTAVFPAEPWMKVSGQNRPLFRDYSNAWTVTGLVSLDGQRFSMTQRGQDLVKGRIWPSEALLQFFGEYSEPMGGQKTENPFAILCAGFLEADRELSLKQVYWGIEKGYRPGVDNLIAVLGALPNNMDDIPATSERRLSLMLKLLERCGIINGAPNYIRVWNSDLAKRVAKSSTTNAPPDYDSLKDIWLRFADDLKTSGISIGKDRKL